MLDLDFGENMKTLPILTIMAVCLATLGCTSVSPRVSSMNFSPESMEILGTGYGESSEGYLFCFIPTGESGNSGGSSPSRGIVPLVGNNPSSGIAQEGSVNGPYSTTTAIKRAVLSKKGDALINTTAEVENGWFIFWCWKTVRVQGTVVKFKQAVVAAPQK